MKIALTVFLLLTFQSVAQQGDSIKIDNSYGFRIIPSAKNNIYGIAFGVIGSEAICNQTYVKKSHGINIQIIGEGFFILLNPELFKYSRALSDSLSFLVKFPEDTNFKAKHNGIIISPLGTYTNVINGISISGCASLGQVINGISLNFITSKYGTAKGIVFALNNQTNKMVGLQLGMFNKTTYLKGIQIGLWNVNSKRKLPIINWSFR